MGESISFSGRVALAQVQRDVANAESKAFEAEKANEEKKKDKRYDGAAGTRRLSLLPKMQIKLQLACMRIRTRPSAPESPNFQLVGESEEKGVSTMILSLFSLLSSLLSLLSSLPPPSLLSLSSFSLSRLSLSV